MASSVILAPGNDALAVPFPTHQCGYCHAPIASGERWVREKIYESLTADGAHYRRYHADLFGDEALSCWEKHQMHQEAPATANRLVGATLTWPGNLEICYRAELRSLLSR